MADYSIQFRILAVDSGWNKPGLIALFREGLNAEIQLVLACKDAGLDLNTSISLAIKLDQHLRGNVCHTPTPVQPRMRHQVRNSTPDTNTLHSQLKDTTQESIQVGLSRLSDEEHLQ